MLKAIAVVPLLPSTALPSSMRIGGEAVWSVMVITRLGVPITALVAVLSTILKVSSSSSSASLLIGITWMGCEVTPGAKVSRVLGTAPKSTAGPLEAAVPSRVLTFTVTASVLAGLRITLQLSVEPSGAMLEGQLIDSVGAASSSTIVPIAEIPLLNG